MTVVNFFLLMISATTSWKMLTSPWPPFLMMKQLTSWMPTSQWMRISTFVNTQTILSLTVHLQFMREWHANGCVPGSEIKFSLMSLLHGVRSSMLNSRWTLWELQAMRTPVRVDLEFSSWKTFSAFSCLLSTSAQLAIMPLWCQLEFNFCPCYRATKLR